VVDPEGSGGQRWLGQLCPEALPKQAGSGRSERRSAFDKRSVRQTQVPTPDEPAFRSPVRLARGEGRRLCQSLPALGKRAGQPATDDATV
jgi:hypothetical protein